MDIVQVLLFIVVLILTGLLLAVGIQVFIILHDARKTLSRINNVLARAEDVSDVTRPVKGISSFMEGARNLKELVNMLAGKHNKLTTNRSFEESLASSVFSEIVAEEKVEANPRISALQERGRGFFHKEGKNLSS